MRDASLKKWKGVTHVSVGLALVAVIVMALGGYATFNEAVDGDLLNNYCGHDDLMNVSRLFFSITILLTYPIECFVCREVIFNLMGKQQDEPMGQDESLLLHVLSTVILVSATFVLSLATDCLGIILELNVSSFVQQVLDRKLRVKIFFKKATREIGILRQIEGSSLAKM